MPLGDPIAYLTGERLAVCAGCGTVSSPLWRGWTAYRGEDAEIGLYCPECSAKKFLHLPRRS